MDNYKEIKIGGAPQEPIEFDLDAIELPETPEEGQETDEAGETPSAPPVKVEVNQEKRQSRAQKRIKQLHDEKREAMLEAQRQKERADELEKRLSGTNKTTKVALKEKIEQEIESTTREMAQAMQDGDSEKVVNLQQKLIKANMQLGSVTHEIDTYKEIEEKPRQQQQPQQAAPQIPEEAMDWLEDHPEFNSDEIFYAAALTINNKLIREGHRTDSAEFYEELDEQLAKRFPEYYGDRGNNVAEGGEGSVQYTKNTPPSNEETKNTSRKPKNREQTVSSSSRSPSASPSVKPQKSTNTVTLTPEHVAMAERWNIPLEQMARRVAHGEKNKGDNGYVPIFIDKKGK